MPTSARLGAEEFVELALLDEFDRGRPALLDLLALVQIRGRRQHHALGIAARMFQRFAQREARLLVVLGDEAAVDVAGADAHFQHDRRVRRFGQFEAFLHRACTIVGRFGRGSSSQTCDFMAKGCERSCMIEEPSP